MATKTRTVTLASGKTAKVPANIDNVVGIDVEGRIVVDHFDAFTAEDRVATYADGMTLTERPFVFGLTLCCNASDKGVEDGIACRSCYGMEEIGMYHHRLPDGSWPSYVDFIVGTPWAPEPAPTESTNPPEKEKRMPKKTPAAEQFAALNIDPADYTPAMALAVKQKWSGLPIDKKVGELRDALAAVESPDVPTVDDLAAQGADDPEAERKRLVRNAKVHVWRQRNQIQAALDARDIRFKAMRAARGSKKAS